MSKMGRTECGNPGESLYSATEPQRGKMPRIHNAGWKPALIWSSRVQMSTAILAALMNAGLLDRLVARYRGFQP